MSLPIVMSNTGEPWIHRAAGECLGESRLICLPVLPGLGLQRTSPMKFLSETNLQKGFSIVELLVVIAVIAVITAISIPSISGMFYKGESARNYRNAQSIVSAFNAARAAGNQESYSKSTAMDAVTSVTGIIGSGTLAGVKFAAPMGVAEKVLAGTFIQGVTTADTTSVLVVH